MEKLPKRERDISKLKYTERASDIWEALGKLQRTGWVNRGVKNPESVQEHTIALRNLVIDLSNQLIEFSEKDKEDILDMLEVHDWAEAIVGDLITVTKDEVLRAKMLKDKSKAETDAMTQICGPLGSAGTEIFNLWTRFEERKDPAALFAHQVDKYQAIEKAIEYEQNGENVSTQEFIEYAEKDIVHPVLVHRLIGVKGKLRNLS